MRAWLVIDYTNDFVADDGKLTTGKAGQVIEGTIVEAIKYADACGDYIVFPTDGHDPKDKYHPENRLFPAHNVMGTSGRFLYKGVGRWYEEHKKQENVYWMDKRYYSSFEATDLDHRLHEHGIKELILMGVCTDICVLHAAIDAYYRGYDVTVLSDGVASFSQSGHEFALNHFPSTLGQRVCSLEELKESDLVALAHQKE
ncbi:cysteine hydrolase [Atopobacter sp. AH10]|uniref:cysteine hydrolase family protein n=1 Tax=Atopobacter sp. AH10 TaxID=2315861 RepID=UPI000EF2676C|nr:isochorismatase family cysteine hydrolase [Atopobacter sp. AH10]RLK62957.1 cysteine hydrolase [Atopobacter sp. AH10]